MWQCHYCQMLCDLWKVHVIWGKFRKFLPVLTTRHLSPKVPSSRQGEHVLRPFGYAMVAKRGDWTPQTCSSSTTMTAPWPAGSLSNKDHNKTPLVSLLQKLGIVDIMAVLHSQQLRWSRYYRLQRPVSKRLVSQMRATLAASREPAGKLWQLCKVLYVFEQITQYLLIHAQFTCIVIFWHICNVAPMIS